jgi:hypothetical protein
MRCVVKDGKSRISTSTFTDDILLKARAIAALYPTDTIVAHTFPHLNRIFVICVDVMRSFGDFVFDTVTIRSGQALYFTLYTPAVGPVTACQYALLDSDQTTI